MKLTVTTVLFLWIVTRTAFAGSIPTTNVLQTEVRLIPDSPMPQEHFGQWVSASSNLFVVAPSKPIMVLDGIQQLATAFMRSDEGPLTSQMLAIPSSFSIDSIEGVAASPSRIAVAASNPFGSAIYLFELQSSVWLYKTNLIPTFSQAIFHVAISSNAVATGTPGQVSVFQFLTNGWVETIIPPPTSAPGVVQANFGRNVALSGAELIIGATGEIRSDPGHAYIYTNTLGSWNFETELSPEPNHFIPFGHAVALDADTALVSAFPGRFNEGEVYVFSRVAGQWVQLAILTSGEPQDFFGDSVAVNGRNILVGAPTAGAGRGSAWLFRKNLRNWDRLRLIRDEMQPTNPTNGMPGDELGFSVAIANNAILLGAPYYDEFANDAGIAFIFMFGFRPFLFPPSLDPGTAFINVADVVLGRTNIMEITTALDDSWTPLKEFVPDHSDFAVPIDFTREPGTRFFRIIVPENSTPKN